MKFRLAGSADEFEVEIVPAGGRSVRVLINGDKELEAVVEPAFIDDAIVRFGRRAMKVLTAHNRNSIWVAAGSAQFEFIPVEARTGRRVHGLATPEITAPMPGKVVKIPVTEGQQVSAGDVLVVLEAMKMETALRAESSAVVKQICADVGQMIDHGAVLLVLSPPPSPSSSEAVVPAR